MVRFEENSMRSLISIVIPVHNVKQYLGECIDSVLGQTYTNLQIILVDDGSSDSSGLICDEYQQKDNRIEVIHQPNGGLSKARNSGMNIAKGEYIYFLDSDDYIQPETIDLLLRAAMNENADVVFFDGKTFFSDCEPFKIKYDYERQSQYSALKGKEQLQKLLERDEYRTPVQMYFYKAAYLLSNNLSFKENILHEDELFSFLCFEADGIFAHVNRPLYARRMRPKSIMTASNAKKKFESMLLIYYELADRYRNGQICGNAARIYMIRTAKSVLAKYILLSDRDKAQEETKLTAFKKDVMQFSGYGDMKLKIKCSGKVMNRYYRVINKFFPER